MAHGESVEVVEVGSPDDTPDEYADEDSGDSVDSDVESVAEVNPDSEVPEVIDDREEIEARILFLACSRALATLAGSIDLSW